MMTNTEAEIAERLSQAAESFDIKIVGASPRVDADTGQIVPNAWVYTARQVVVEKDGRFKDLPDGVAWHGKAYNSFEANNAGFGIQGSGDDVDHLPDGLAPIGAGAVIQSASRRMNDAGEIEVLFSAPNNPSGRCLS